jgi:hypothetical protein
VSVKAATLTNLPSALTNPSVNLRKSERYFSQFTCTALHSLRLNIIRRETEAPSGGGRPDGAGRGDALGRSLAIVAPNCDSATISLNSNEVGSDSCLVAPTTTVNINTARE